jgi:hypothetical protein
LLRRPFTYESHAFLAPQHKTGTVLLQHLLKDACPILGWKCTFNDGERSEVPTNASVLGSHVRKSRPPLRPIWYPKPGVRIPLAAVPTKCNGPEQARAAGLHLCFQQHGVRFKLGTVRA